MSERTTLLEYERRKLDWLREKVAEQERRVHTLEELQDDPLDDMFQRDLISGAFRVQTGAPVQTPGQAATDSPRVFEDPLLGGTGPDLAADSWAKKPWLPSQAWTRTPRQMPEKWVQIIKFIGKDGKTYAQVKQFIDDAKLQITADAVRTGLMNYRKDFGLIENPRRGFYTVTDKGLELVKTQENESPALSEASEPQTT